jgi:uncharacterized protein (TIGR00299 family) protein
MNIAYFDTVAGIAGDMTMAAFVSAGLPIEYLSAELSKLPLDGFELIPSHVRRNHIDAVHIDVAVSREPHFHRDMQGILGLLNASTLSERVKNTASAIFTVIGTAEARVHNVPIEKVHFHEVGAVDSIVDVVGAAICLEKFGIDRVYSSPVPLGRSGVISTQHGLMPIPAPAALEILKDYPVLFTSIPHELTTPTGAAIIRTLSHGLLDREMLRVREVGYGAGTLEIAEVPNFLRVIIGELPAESERETILTVETNIDDMNPQMYPALIEQLLEAGAHDAYLVPILMKKGRPGILLSAMVPQNRLERVSAIIYRETTTIGLRVQEIGRTKLPRRHLEVITSFGSVRAKAVLREGREVIAPEFEECRRIARETGRPILEITRVLEQELSIHHSSPGTEPREDL